MPSDFTVRVLLLAEIRADENAQPREHLNHTVANDYCERMQDGDKFPPVVVFHDGETYWLADGFHRLLACKKANILDIEAEVRPGGLREAQFFAASANETHGMRRTAEDRRRAVKLLLLDPDWSQWPDREIARQTHTYHTLVDKVRLELQGEALAAEQKEQQRRQRETNKTAQSGQKSTSHQTEQSVPEVEVKEPVAQPIPAPASAVVGEWKAPPPLRHFPADRGPCTLACETVVNLLEHDAEPMTRRESWIYDALTFALSESKKREKPKPSLLPKHANNDVTPQFKGKDAKKAEKAGVA